MGNQDVAAHDVAQIYEADDGYRWRVLARNGEVIASGEAYNNKKDVEEMLSRHFPYASLVDLSLAEGEE